MIVSIYCSESIGEVLGNLHVYIHIIDIWQFPNNGFLLFAEEVSTLLYKSAPTFESTVGKFRVARNNFLSCVKRTYVCSKFTPKFLG